MKVYVESKYIPEKCSKCKFIGHYEDGIYKRNPHCCCELYWDLHQDEIRVDKNSRDERCPLQSLSDYTKQVRKEVLEKVYKVLEQAVPHDLCWSWAVIKKELDQIQGEKNDYNTNSKTYVE